jgi:RHS repeat-associated protein
MLVDGYQHVAAQYRYDPFGNQIAELGTLADANVYRFSSKEYHAPSGLYYYGFRFYDPNTQRWLNRDPIEERGGINLYAYVRNRITSRIDPIGLCNEYCLWGMGGQGMGNFASQQGIHALADAAKAATDCGFPVSKLLSAAADEDFQQALDELFPNDEFLLLGFELPITPTNDEGEGYGYIEGAGILGFNRSGPYWGGLGATGYGLMYGYEATNQGRGPLWFLDLQVGYGLFRSDRETGVFIYWPPHGSVFIGGGIGWGR